MNKEFIPYEEALALKELGFDEEEWVKEQVKLFKRNFPELLGFHQNKED